MDYKKTVFFYILTKINKKRKFKPKNSKYITGVDL